MFVRLERRHRRKSCALQSYLFVSTCMAWSMSNFQSSMTMRERILPLKVGSCQHSLHTFSNPLKSVPSPSTIPACPSDPSAATIRRLWFAYRTVQSLHSLIWPSSPNAFVIDVVIHQVLILLDHAAQRRCCGRIPSFFEDGQERIKLLRRNHVERCRTAASNSRVVS